MTADSPAKINSFESSPEHNALAKKITFTAPP